MDPWDGMTGDLKMKFGGSMGWDGMAGDLKMKFGVSMGWDDW